MGEVAVTYKVMPDSVEIDLENLKSGLESKLAKVCKLQGIDEQPVAFGLKALMVKLVIEDAEGTLDRVEGIIQEVQGVQSVDMTEMGRLL